MAYVQLPIRTSADLNSAADINQLQENCDYLRSIVDPYSAYYVQSTPPSGPAYGTLWYDTTTNKLYKYSDTDWIEIDWQQIVKATPEWQAGTLRVNSGVLQITPNSGTNWYNCYPAVGAKVIELATLDNTSYTYKYWISPGQMVIIRNANHVPIVYAKNIVPFFSASYFHSYAYESWIGLRPSNVAISNGDGQYMIGQDTTISAYRITSLSIVPIYDQSDTTTNWANFEIRITQNNNFYVNSVGQAGGGNAVSVVNCSGTASETSYWLGTWFDREGTQFTMNYLVLTRRG